jgi:protein-S-isoprenylcysteine O-methyltransferase Ste14
MSLIPVFKIGVWNAWIFMSVFLIQMIPMMFINKQAGKRSHLPPEIRKNKSEKYVSTLANAIWLIALLYSVFLPFLTSTPWFYAGLFVFIIGLIILGIATVNFITAPTDHPITNGVYRLTRHPMYLSTFLICIGAGIACASWLFILLTIIMIYCFHKEALIEEKYCLNKYSDEYQKYMDTVPRWIGLNSPGSA